MSLREAIGMMQTSQKVCVVDGTVVYKGVAGNENFLHKLRNLFRRKVVMMKTDGGDTFTVYVE